MLIKKQLPSSNIVINFLDHKFVTLSIIRIYRMPCCDSCSSSKSSCNSCDPCKKTCCSKLVPVNKCCATKESVVLVKNCCNPYKVVSVPSSCDLKCCVRPDFGHPKCCNKCH